MLSYKPLLPFRTVITRCYQQIEHCLLKNTRLFNRTQACLAGGQISALSTILIGEMRVQASPFVTEKHHIPDPRDDGKGYCWVSVILPPEVKNGTYSDEEIMLFVIKKCKAGRTAMTHQPLHGLGDHCISLPVKWNTPRQNMRAVRDQAAALASWWFVQIQQKRVTIDQKMLIDDRTTEETKRILDVIPLEWEKPDYSN